MFENGYNGEVRKIQITTYIHFYYENAKDIINNAYQQLYTEKTKIFSKYIEQTKKKEQENANAIASMIGKEDDQQVLDEICSGEIFTEAAQMFEGEGDVKAFSSFKSIKKEAKSRGDKIPDLYTYIMEKTAELTGQEGNFSSFHRFTKQFQDLFNTYAYSQDITTDYIDSLLQDIVDKADALGSLKGLPFGQKLIKTYLEHSQDGFYKSIGTGKNNVNLAVKRFIAAVAALPMADEAYLKGKAEKVVSRGKVVNGKLKQVKTEMNTKARAQMLWLDRILYETVSLDGAAKMLKETEIFKNAKISIKTGGGIGATYISDPQLEKITDSANDAQKTVNNLRGSFVSKADNSIVFIGENGAKATVWVSVKKGNVVVDQNQYKHITFKAVDSTPLSTLLQVGANWKTEHFSGFIQLASVHETLKKDFDSYDLKLQQKFNNIIDTTKRKAVYSAIVGYSDKVDYMKIGKTFVPISALMRGLQNYAERGYQGFSVTAEPKKGIQILTYRNLNVYDPLDKKETPEGESHDRSKKLVSGAMEAIEETKMRIQLNLRNIPINELKQ